jgi:hypothetical protein
MSVNISQETEDWLMREAQRQGISVDALLEQLIAEHARHTATAAPDELPVLRLGLMGPLHRRDIYDDAR